VLMRGYTFDQMPNELRLMFGNTNCLRFVSPETDDLVLVR
jgi:hypothetical protein